MQVEISEDKIDKLSIKFVGDNRIDTTNLSDLKQQLVNILESLENKKKELLLDFRNIDFIDSSGLAFVISLYKNNPKEFQVINSSDFIRELFSVTRIDTFINVS